MEFRRVRFRSGQFRVRYRQPTGGLALRYPSTRSRLWPSDRFDSAPPDATKDCRADRSRYRPLNHRINHWRSTGGGDHEDDINGWFNLWAVMGERMPGLLGGRRLSRCLRIKYRSM